MRRTLVCPFFRRAFGWCVPIGGLGGLIGLGGGEFRLPVLMYAIGFDAKAALPLNLMVSAVTLAFAMMTRSTSLSAAAVLPYWPEIVGLAAGGIFSVFQGVRLVHRLTSKRLVQVVAVLLAAIGLLLLTEAATPFHRVDLLPDDAMIHFVVAALIGTGIGLVSSMLGVAGGELLIPTLIFIFGADIRTAGTASALISLCLITVGLFRYWHMGALPQGRGVHRITTAMSLGSMVGAAVGGMAAAVAPVAFLKILLGGVLIAAAGKVLLNER
jgi:uncharacterized protein